MWRLRNVSYCHACRLDCKSAMVENLKGNKKYWMNFYGLLTLPKCSYFEIEHNIFALISSFSNFLTSLHLVRFFRLIAPRWPSTAAGVVSLKYLTKRQKLSGRVIPNMAIVTNYPIDLPILVIEAQIFVAVNKFQFLPNKLIPNHHQVLTREETWTGDHVNTST